MLSYRITKFDPKNRDKDGAYQDETEWTAMSDIGKAAYRNVTFAEYEQVEKAYVEAIKAVMIDQDINILEIQDLESHFITSKKNLNSAGWLEDLRI